MLWILIGIIFIILGFIFLFVHIWTPKRRYDGSRTEDGTNDVLGFLFCMGTIFIMIPLMAFFWYWIPRESSLRLVPTAIANKIQAINEMKKTYYNPPQGIQFNVDMANKDLAAGINAAIVDLRDYVNEKNEIIAIWQIKRDYWLINSCWVEPPIINPIRLSDYKL